jgi:predicted amidohydrolase YtcJ
MPIRLGYSNRNCQQVEPDVPGCFLRSGDIAGLGDDDNFFWNVGITLGGIDNGPPAICTTMEAPPADKAKEECILQPGNDYWKAIYGALRSRYRYVVNHSWGDKGVDYVLDIMDQVLKDNPDITLDFMRSLRVSSDHCGFYPRAEQLPRMAKYNMMISCSAGALGRSAPYLKIYGADKAAQISPIRSILNAGIMVVNENEGWDASRGEARPVHMGAMALITRKNNRGDTIAPQEAIDRVTLLKMETVWPSYYVLKEKKIGTLEAGKLADIAVWNKDYFTVPEQELKTVYPVMTILGGKTMVLREEFAKELGTAPVGPQTRFVFTPQQGGVYGGGDGE